MKHKDQFNVKGFALSLVWDTGLALKQRLGATQKWSILRALFVNMSVVYEYT